MKTLHSLILTLVIAVAPALSQGLTSNQVERFLNSIDKLNELPDADEEEMADLDMDPEVLQEKMTSPFTSSLTEMRSQKMYSQGLAIIKGAGFSDEVEWASVGDRMMRAYAALKMGDEEPEIDEKMAKALEELENSDLPEEMKQKMRDAMSMSKGLVKTVQDVPPGDIKAVEPHVARLEQMSAMPEDQ